MLVNTQRDTDIVSVSNRTEPEEEKESRTREKALERNKKKLQEKKEAVTENPDTVSSIHEKIMKQKDSDEKTENPMQTDFSGYAEKSGKSYTGKTTKKKPADEVLCVNAKAAGSVKDSVTDLVSLSDAEYSGNKDECNPKICESCIRLYHEGSFSTGKNDSNHSRKAGTCIDRRGNHSSNACCRCTSFHIRYGEWSGGSCSTV